MVGFDTSDQDWLRGYQLTDANGRLELLTDGKSRNGLNAWAKDGTLVAFTSTRDGGREVSRSCTASCVRTIAAREAVVASIDQPCWY